MLLVQVLSTTLEMYVQKDTLVEVVSFLTSDQTVGQSSRSNTRPSSPNTSDINNEERATNSSDDGSICKKKKQDT
ncbi:hypothetical protein JTE90_024851 [Oedothorax gibbosus]|uniref:Uncharacterized protein n=1 Tax=Oedothorax gibbosus TaxID=931172 RepID=A0AAV6V4A7_9ARAC|nr:hypothetical protein JTE90_024851 [Oedothorax gibbosus]